MFFVNCDHNQRASHKLFGVFGVWVSERKGGRFPEHLPTFFQKIFSQKFYHIVSYMQSYTDAGKDEVIRQADVFKSGRCLRRPVVK